MAARKLTCFFLSNFPYAWHACGSFMVRACGALDRQSTPNSSPGRRAPPLAGAVPAFLSLTLEIVGESDNDGHARCCTRCDTLFSSNARCARDVNSGRFDGDA